MSNKEVPGTETPEPGLYEDRTGDLFEIRGGTAYMIIKHENEEGFHRVTTNPLPVEDCDSLRPVSEADARKIEAGLLDRRW